MNKREAELRNMLLFSFLWKGKEFTWRSPWNTYFFQSLFHSVSVLIWILTLSCSCWNQPSSVVPYLYCLYFFILGQGLFQQHISVWNEKVALVSIFYQKLMFINLNPKIKGKPHLKGWICLHHPSLGRKYRTQLTERSAPIVLWVFELILSIFWPCTQRP